MTSQQNLTTSLTQAGETLYRLKTVDRPTWLQRARAALSSRNWQEVQAGQIATAGLKEGQEREQENLQREDEWYARQMGYPMSSTSAKGKKLSTWITGEGNTINHGPRMLPLILAGLSMLAGGGAVGFVAAWLAGAFDKPDVVAPGTDTDTDTRNTIRFAD